MLADRDLVEQNSGECEAHLFIMILHENIVNLVVHLWSFTDEILRDAIDNDIAFLVVGDPLGYVKHYTYLLFSIIIVIVS